ncbi:MAG: glycosyl hydrolase [Pseudomonadota bacterium]
MMDGTLPDPSRRALLRGAFAAEDETACGWHLVTALAAGSGDVFWDGWADDAGVFVAGDDGVLFHFDGQDWTRQAAPAPVPIHALWGRSRTELWAVGWMGQILRYDGAGWQAVQGCEVNAAGKYASTPVNTPLFAIDGLADGRAWAVGDRGTILHYNGDTWLPEPSGTRAHLRAITALPEGRMLAAGGDGTVLIRDADGDWRTETSPVHSNFAAALTLPDGSVLLAGGRYFVGAGGFRGDLVLWTERGMTKLFEGADFARFRALAACKRGVVAVGDAGQIHVIHEGRITRVDTGIAHDILGIVTLPSGEALAMGDFGTVLAGRADALSHFTPYVAASAADPVWYVMDSGTDRQLWGLWHDRVRGELFACGEEGTVLVEDRDQWEALPPVGKLGIHALHRAPDGMLLAAGQMGEIHAFDGARWEKVFDLHMDITILSLWSDGATLIAAGDEGLVLQNLPETTDWTRMASGTKSALYGLWGLDDHHLLAVGDFGLVQRWNGTRWDAFNAGTEYFLFDVWGRGLNDIFVVGLSGTIGHFNGERWTITPARARSDLLAVTGDAEQVIAVGAAGAVYRHDGRRWAPESAGTALGLRAVATTPEGGFVAAGDQGSLLRRRV